MGMIQKEPVTLKQFVPGFQKSSPHLIGGNLIFFHGKGKAYLLTFRLIALLSLSLVKDILPGQPGNRPASAMALIFREMSPPKVRACWKSPTSQG